jgi:hypothetical protein
MPIVNSRARQLVEQLQHRLVDHPAEADAQCRMAVAVEERVDFVWWVHSIALPRHR